MSYNDPTDVEAALEQTPTPPAAPVLNRGQAPHPISDNALPSSIAAAPTPVGVPSPVGSLGGAAPVSPSTELSTTGPAQKQAAAASATVQLAPVAPPATPTIALLLQTPLSAPQTPQTTDPGTVVQATSSGGAGASGPVTSPPPPIGPQ